VKDQESRILVGSDRTRKNKNRRGKDKDGIKLANF